MDDDDYYEEDVGYLEEESDIKEEVAKSKRLSKKENVKSTAEIVPIQCRICYKVYNIRGSNCAYKAHFLKMHPENQYYRPKKHRMIDKHEKYPCRECGKIFGSFKNQSNHLIRVHYLKKAEETEMILQYNQNFKSNQDDFEQKVEQYVRDEKDEAKAKMKIDMKAENTCSICGKSVPKFKHAWHLKTVHGEVICACGDRFSHEFEFYDHKYSFSINERPKHKISSDNTAPNYMDNDQDKEEEEQDEDKQKTYSPCSRCHEAFPNSFLLRRHMLDNHWEELKQKNMLFLHEYKYRVKNIFCDYEGCER